MPGTERLLAAIRSGDEAAAEAAASFMADQSVSEAPSLQEMLHAAEPDERWWAVRTLAGMRDPQTKWFVDALRDANAEVRAAAALALAAHADLAAAEALLIALGDEDALVGHMAVNALVHMGPQVVPHILEHYPRAGQRARINALRVLAELQDHRAIRLMMDALTAESAAVQYWAREGLERLGLNMVYLRPD